MKMKKLKSDRVKTIGGLISKLERLPRCRLTGVAHGSRILLSSGQCCDGIFRFLLKFAPDQVAETSNRYKTEGTSKWASFRAVEILHNNPVMMEAIKIAYSDKNYRLF